MAGKSTHTAKFGRWDHLWYYAFPDKFRSLKFEKYLKPHSGRSLLQKKRLTSSARCDRRCRVAHDTRGPIMLEAIVIILAPLRGPPLAFAGDPVGRYGVQGSNPGNKSPY